MSNTPPVVLSQQSLLYTLFNKMIDSTAMADLAPTLDLMLLLPSTLISADKPLVKDDVFLAQPWIYQDKPFTHHFSTKLPPVTLPTHFLLNHEPLFDGIEIPWDKPDRKEPRRMARKEKVRKRRQRLCPPAQTMFQQLTEANIDWCRYCGTTEGVNWRPGPWGKRTLCNKHGCDYKGYGLASRLPRLDLSKFSQENLNDRLRPVLQLFCTHCHSPQDSQENPLIVCQGGCSRAYHPLCYPALIQTTTSPWYCHSTCKENRQRNRVAVELPRKHTPLMHLLSLKIIKS